MLGVAFALHGLRREGSACFALPHGPDRVDAGRGIRDCADGSRIYFADVLPCNGGSVNCHVKVVDLATGVVTPLSTNAVDPRISPDGSLIVFRRGSGLGIMNSDGTNAHMIMTEGGSNLYPEWSTDGSRIYFTRIAFDGSEAVYSMDVTGGDLQTEVLPILAP